jgi:hypothetical protein
LQQAEAWFEDAGLGDVKSELERFRLLFKSSREFFFAPVIEYGPLDDWKAIAGRGKQMQDAFWEVKNAIDAYFNGTSFAVTVVAGCVRGRKPPHEAHPIALRAADDDEEPPTAEVQRVTGEIELVEQAARLPQDEKDDSEGHEPSL